MGSVRGEMVQHVTNRHGDTWEKPASVVCKILLFTGLVNKCFHIFGEGGGDESSGESVSGG